MQNQKIKIKITQLCKTTKNKISMGVGGGGEVGKNKH